MECTKAKCFKKLRFRSILCEKKIASTFNFCESSVGHGQTWYVSLNMISSWTSFGKDGREFWFGCRMIWCVPLNQLSVWTFYSTNCMGIEFGYEHFLCVMLNLVSLWTWGKLAQPASKASHAFCTFGFVKLACCTTVS